MASEFRPRFGADPGFHQAALPWLLPHDPADQASRPLGDGGCTIVKG
jgi:hypothetical protein